MAPSQKDTVRALVTGYGPFMQYKENPSWLAVKPLHDTTLKVVPQPPTDGNASSSPEASRKVHITALGIPTSYDFVLQNVPGLHEKPPVAPVSDDPAYFPADLPPKGFHFILHVGVAGPGGVTLETVGHKTGYGLPDANGKLAPVVGTDKQGREVRGFAEGYEDLPEELRTSIDAPALKKHLQETSVKNVGVSTDAGHYLCDFVFYCSLAEAQKRESGVPVLFFHCPPIGQPYSTEEVTGAITKVVEWVGARVPL